MVEFLNTGEVHMQSKFLGLSHAALIAAGLSGAAFGPAAPSLAAGDPVKAEGYLKEANKALEKGDAKTAVIQLKNAVQADPDNGRARFELGSVELRLGDYLSAEKELRNAIDRKFDRDQVAPPLAETLLRMGKTKELLDEIPAGDRMPETEALVRITRGFALLSQRNVEQAKQSFSDAIARTAKPARAQLGFARAF